MAETVNPRRCSTADVRRDRSAGQRAGFGNVREPVVRARRGHWRRSAFTQASSQFEEFDRQVLTGPGTGPATTCARSSPALQAVIAVFRCHFDYRVAR